jgi:hypothetical protein
MQKVKYETMSQQSSPLVTRKASAVVGWFPTTPATELAVLQGANARQVALRGHLRHLYWLSECRPITAVAVTMQRRSMVSIAAQDSLDDDEVDQLLSAHFGFEPIAGGWCIPELDEGHRTALASITSQRERASAAGKASAAARKAAGKSPEADRLEAAEAPGPLNGPSADTEDF